MRPIFLHCISPERNLPGGRAAAFSDRGLSPTAELVSAWRGLLRDLFDPYRPERHYMRGPGPRWRERNRTCCGTAAAGEDLPWRTEAPASVKTFASLSTT
ncbi:MAG: hypothetical protein QOD74_1219 [Variibacter sp.]|nr:hypothetical protein [Variibacter sp.]